MFRLSSLSLSTYSLFISLLISLANPLFAQDPTNTQPDLIDFSKKTETQVAELMATISKATYEPASDDDLKRLPMLKNAQKILAKQDSILALLMNQGDEMIIAFRGSDNTSNWVNNLDFLQTSIDQEGFKLHKGFYESYLSIKDQIISNLQTKKPKSIRLTGHSLGGALAQITAYFLTKSGYKISSVYTFGAPIVGDQKWYQAYQSQLKNQSFTWELFTDPVPSLLAMDDELNLTALPAGQIRYLDCPCQSQKCMAYPERRKMDLDPQHLLLQIKTMLYVKGMDVLMDQMDTSNLSKKENMLLRQYTAIESAKLFNIEICTNIFSYHWLIDSFDQKYLEKLAEKIANMEGFSILELLRKIDPLHGIENYERVLHYMDME
jgi:hypothetical protein